MGGTIDATGFVFVFGVLSVGAGCVVFLWTRLNAQRTEIMGGCAACRTEYQARFDDFRREVNGTITRIHERLDGLQAEMVDRDDLKEIREDIRGLRDQLALLNANLPKFMAGLRPAE